MSDAAGAIHADTNLANSWVNQQKECLKTGHQDEVIAALQSYVEPETVEDSEAVIRSCHRYLSRRKGQLDYAGALAKKLPIGSGEIESAHRYIVQKRLKLSGSWWSPANGDYMLSLRLNRANKKWGKYWEQVSNAA